MSNQELDISSINNYQHQGSLYQSFQNDFLKQGHHGDNEIIKCELIYSRSNNEMSQTEKQTSLGYTNRPQQLLINEVDNQSNKQQDQVNGSPILIEFDSSQKMKENTQQELVTLKIQSSNEHDQINNQFLGSETQFSKTSIGQRQVQKRFSYQNYSKFSKNNQQDQNSVYEASKHPQKNIGLLLDPDSFVSVNQTSFFSPKSGRNQLFNKSNGGSPFNQSLAQDKMFQIKQSVSNSEQKGQQLYQQKTEKAINIIQQIKNNQTNRLIRINQILRKFITLLRIYAGQNYVSHLQKYQLDQIQDKSSFFQFKVKHRILSKISSIFSQIFQSCPINIPLILPTQIFHIVWDIFLVLYTVPLLMIFSILTFCASHEKDVYFSSYFSNITLIIFILDIIFNFNTAHFNKDVIVLDRKLIAKKYLQYNFFPDIIAVIVIIFKHYLTQLPLFYNPDDNAVQYIINVLVFLKLKCIPQKINKFEELMQTKETQKHKLRLLKLIIQIILIAHSIAIGWHIMVILENNYGVEQTWITQKKIQNEHWFTKYIYSFYWCITTMTTVGFGDITPANQYEGMFMSAAMIFMSCIFAYTISNVGMILQEIEKNHKELTSNISNIQRYLNRKNVNISLKSRVRNYLVFLSEEQKDRNKEAEDQVFNKLSNKLREEITIEINGKIVHSNTILTKNFSVQTLNKIVFAMKEYLVSPNEIIFKEDELDDKALYFIQGGFVDIFFQKYSDKNKQYNQIFVKRLGQNSIFGELSFFSGLPRKAGVKSVGLATLYKLTQEDFLNILKENKEDFERFKMIREQILFQQDYKAINIECYSCSSLGHISSQCPIVHHQRNKQFLSLKNNFSIPQSRNQNYTKHIRIRYHARCFFIYSLIIQIYFKSFILSIIQLQIILIFQIIKMLIKNFLINKINRFLIQINMGLQQKLKEELCMDSFLKSLFTKDTNEKFTHSSSSNSGLENSEDDQQVVNSQNSLNQIPKSNINIITKHTLHSNSKQEDQRESLLNILQTNQQIINDEYNEMILSLNGKVKAPPTSSNNDLKIVNKQTSLNERARQNEKSIVKFESQIAEVDEDLSNQSIKDIERQSHQTLRVRTIQEKKSQHKLLRGSRESIQIGKGESEYHLNSLLSQEIPILSPKILSIPPMNEKGSQLESINLQNIEKQANNFRKSRKRFATQPPQNNKTNQLIPSLVQISQKQEQVIFSPIVEKLQVDNYKQTKSPLLKSKLQGSTQVIPLQLMQQSGGAEKQDLKIKGNFDLGKRRQSKFLLNHLNSVHTASDNKINSIMNLKLDEEAQLICQTPNQNQNLPQMDIDKLLLLNQLSKRNNYNNSDLLQQLDQKTFTKYYYTYTFEDLRIFKRFFPHNNYDKVIQKIKSVQQNLKKQRKQRQLLMNKKQKAQVKQLQKELSSNYSTPQLKKNQSSQDKTFQFPQQNVSDLFIKPSYLCYGISAKNFKLYPTNKLQIEQ